MHERACRQVSPLLGNIGEDKSEGGGKGIGIGNVVKGKSENKHKSEKRTCWGYERERE